jgi:Family of unknown function (DUF6232)
MTLLFRDDELMVTDEWIRTSTATFAIAEVRRAWVGRGRVGAGGRALTGGAVAGALLVVIGAVGASGWLTRNWGWLLVAPALFFVAGSIGLFDPVAIYLEKRHHELWIATDTVAVRVYRANRVEANKALRAIQRANERRNAG